MRTLLIILGFVLVIGAFVSSVANAHMVNGDIIENDGEELQSDEHKSLEEILPQILKKYNVDAIQELDCDKVIDEDFEMIGDGVMESMSPDQAHSVMDEMMARLPLFRQGDNGQEREGSKNLEEAHINMGRNYLGCNKDNGQFGMMGINAFMPMMAGSNWTNFGAGSELNLIWTINGLLISALLIVLIRYFWKKGGDKK